MIRSRGTTCTSNENVISWLAAVHRIDKRRTIHALQAYLSTANVIGDTYYELLCPYTLEIHYTIK